MSNILSCIPTTNIFIEAGVENGGVLVHCFGGKSRSPAFIAAYLMSSRGWSFDEAYNVIKQARPVIDINPGFECQLRAYAAAHCDVYVAQQLLLRTRVRELQLLRGDAVVLSGDCKVSEHIGFSQALTATANLHQLNSKFKVQREDKSNEPPSLSSAVGAEAAAHCPRSHGTEDEAAGGGNVSVLSIDCQSESKSDSRLHGNGNGNGSEMRKGLIDLARIPSNIRLSGAHELSDAKKSPIEALSSADSPGAFSCPSPKIVATAATYGATAHNTEHDDFVSSPVSTRNASVASTACAGTGGMGVGVGSSSNSSSGSSAHKKRAYSDAKSSRPQSAEQEDPPLQRASPNGMVIINGCNGQDNTNNDGYGSVDDDDDDYGDADGAMDIDTTDGQEERTIQNLAAAYDTLAAQAAMSGLASASASTGQHPHPHHNQYQYDAGMSSGVMGSMSLDAGEENAEAGVTITGAVSRSPFQPTMSASIDRTDLHHHHNLTSAGASAGGGTGGAVSSSSMRHNFHIDSNSMMMTAIDRARSISELSPSVKTFSASPNTITQAMSIGLGGCATGGAGAGTSGSGGASGLHGAVTSSKWGDRDVSGGRSTGRHHKSSRRGSGRSRGGGGGGSGNAEVEVKTPICRLSRPGSNWVRVIPPLRGLEREFNCSWCNTALFTFANVIRTDLDVAGLLDQFHHQYIAPAKSEPQVAEGETSSSTSSSSFSCSNPRTQEVLQTGIVLPKLPLVNPDGSLIIPTGPKSARSLEEKHPYHFDPGASATTQESATNDSTNHGDVQGLRNGSNETGNLSSRRNLSNNGARMMLMQDDDDGCDGGHGHGDYSATADAKDVHVAGASSSNAVKSSAEPAFNSRPALRTDPHSASSSAKNSPRIPTDAAAYHASNSSGDGVVSGSRSRGMMELDQLEQVQQEHLSPGKSNIPSRANFPPSMSRVASKGPVGFSVGRSGNAGGSGGRFGIGAAGARTSRATEAKGFDFDIPLIPDESHEVTDIIKSNAHSRSRSGSPTTRLKSVDEMAVVCGDGNAPNTGAAETGAGVNSSSSDRALIHDNPAAVSFVLESINNRDATQHQQQRHHHHGNSGGGGGTSGDGCVNTTSSADILASSPTSFGVRALSMIEPQYMYSGGHVDSSATGPGGSNSNSNSNSSANGCNDIARDGGSITGECKPSNGGSTALFSSSGSGRLNRAIIPPRSSSMTEFYTDDSPRSRMSIPPHRVNEQQWKSYFNGGRPQSAEKRRWIARMNLLREGDHKLAKMADDDETASVSAFGRDKYLHVEYLDWMGLDVFRPERDSGNIQCFCCKKTIGSWMWNADDRYYSDLS